ncbi:NAD-dependent epimerase/dehydratase terH [Lachnellula arida]|uniref:NAD-dependent epimerase/dehydratase terH n=1 Tax=Lachnellula arida TaxID=1316785 RepID=A0A8T9BAC1_9HELO|nr:NAD-dependent epimerase/dehydratase terH [Lachnellula arida]
MASSSSIVPPGGLVLVTGVTGFIGSYVASGLLGLGYRVRGTVRSTDKAAWVTQAMTERHSSADFEAVVLPDQNATGAWDGILKDVDGIAHVAADTSFGPDPNKVITPSVAGLRRFLEAANNKESSVKRFVLTSSNQAALNRTVGKEMLVNGSMWNEEAMESAWRPPPYAEDRSWDVYSALKAQTEREMWTFSQEENPKFVVNSVLPSCTIGAVFHEKQAGSTAKWVLDTFKDPANHDFLKGFGASHFCYVEDVALLHIGALTQEGVKNERLFGFGGAVNFNSWLDVFRKLGPSTPGPEDDPAQLHDLSTIDGKTELNLLKYFGKAGWTNFDHSVRKLYSLVDE